MAGGLVAGLEGASASLEGSAVDNAASSQIAAFGFMGLVCAFLIIILASIAMGAKSKKSGILLILCAIGGAIAGGTFVAVCMILTLAGGIMATLGTASGKTE